MIYEKDGDNYAVRYYSLSLKNVSSVEIPDTYNGRDVIGIRGNVFKR